MPKEQYSERLNVMISARMSADIDILQRRHKFARTTDVVRLLLQIGINRVKSGKDLPTDY